MHLSRTLAIVASALAALLLASPAAHAQSISQFIVRFKPEVLKAGVPATQRVARLAAESGVAVSHARDMALGAQVVKLDHSVDAVEASAIARRLAQDPSVEFADPDLPMHPAFVPNDEFYAALWYLANSPVAISAEAAWDITRGSAGTVVAVIDTGVLPHAGLAGRLLPGYDFVSDPLIANDGNGRDADASDPGDWISQADRNGAFAGRDCALSNSSWHGTGVAGIIGANTNDRAWTAGIDWNARILPVRVLGKCGGSFSDIIDGMAWAAGLSVPGAPRNPTPAHVLNLSLGGAGSCPGAAIAVINAALTNGVTQAIVAAAGNEEDDVSNHTPANCPGVISVASTRSNGDKAAYSNYGTGITISAPGGQYLQGGFSDGIYVLSNSGTTVPVSDAPANGYGGTSFAAPMVSGTIALMHAVAPGLSYVDVKSVLTSTAKPFLANSNCTPLLCGPGIVDASAAVAAAQALAGPPATLTLVEYYNASLDHYFITWMTAEQANLDAGNTPTRWTRTGYTFKAFAVADASTSPVCRYYIPPLLGDSHFFGRGIAECNETEHEEPDFRARGRGIHADDPAGRRCLPRRTRCRSIACSMTGRTRTTAT